MYFDTHTHVNSTAFKEDSVETVKRALDNQTWLINVGTGFETSSLAVNLAKNYESGVYASIGLHPNHTQPQMDSPAEIFLVDEYDKLITTKVVAVGECGLDYFRIPQESNKELVIEKQKAELIKQLKFANQHQLPVIIHCREAHRDLLDILKIYPAGASGVIHSFTESWETAKQFLDMGFYIAVNGILTFDKTGRLAEVVKNIPINKLLTETDAPYLTPPPFRGKRNEPAYVQYVVNKIAEIHGMSTEAVGNQTFENACRLFKIKTAKVSI